MEEQPAAALINGVKQPIATSTDGAAKPKFQLSTAYLLKFFFTNYLWFGVVVVFISALADSYLNTEIFILKAAIDMVEAIGISIVVAACFTFASGTSEFLNKISDLLREIVIGKDFLINLDSTTKKDILSSIIKPSFEERKIYLNIEDYFNTYINRTMEVTRTSVRSNYNLSHRAYLCSENKIVAVESIINYRLYPGIEGYTPVKVGFNHDDDKSYCAYIIVNSPNGKREVSDKKKLEYSVSETEAGKLKLTSIDLSRHKHHSHLDIEIKMVEFGYDHWGVAELQFMLPTDGFKYQLRCENDLEIKQWSTFVYGAKFFIDTPAKHEMSMACTEWINEGTGFSVVIGPNENLACTCVRVDP